MVENRIVGYMWIILGVFCLISFGGRLFLQLLGVLAGASLVFKGLRILAVDRAFYNYSRSYFDDQFRR